MAFFENFGKAVADTYKSAAKASGRLIEEGKLKLIISDNESQMQDIFETIGREYCECFFRGEIVDNSKFENEYEELKRMQLENDESRNKLLNLKKLRKCTKCEQEININHIYCENCGQRQPEIVEENEEKEREKIIEEEKVCQKCNAKLGKDDNFCPFCGENV